MGRVVVAVFAQRRGGPQARGARPALAQHHSGGGEGGPAVRRVRTRRSRALRDVPLRAYGRPCPPDAAPRLRCGWRAGQRDVPERGGPRAGLRSGRAQAGGRNGRRARRGVRGRGIGTGCPSGRPERRLIEMAFHPRERSPWRRSMSRREALRLIAGTAVAGGLLAGCDSGGGSSSASRVVIGTREDPVKQPLYDDNPMIESGLEPEKGPLRLYNWSEYIYTRVLKDFEEEFGVEVELTTFYNLEEATQKLRTGKVNFDVFFPTAEVIPKFVAGKLLQPLNHDYLPNLEKNVWPALADPFYDRGSRYTTPYVTYSTGIGWRTDMVPADVAGMDNPWEIFWDPEYKGITGLYDEYRDALSVGMYRSGLTGVNEANASDLNKARDNLLELPDLVDIRYTIDG